MLEHWTSEVIDVMGWPEWFSGALTRSVLERVADEWKIWHESSCTFTAASPHVALCLLRDWARAYLRKFRVAVNWNPAKKRWYVDWGHAPTRAIRLRLDKLPHFADQDEALATAVLATREKEG